MIQNLYIEGILAISNTSLQPYIQPITFTVGDNYNLYIHITDSDGYDVNLTSSAVILTIKQSNKLSANTPVTLSREIIVTGITTGDGYFIISNSDTQVLSSNSSLEYDVALIDALGNISHIVPVSPNPILKSDFISGQPVTVPESQEPLAQGPQGIQGPIGPQGIQGPIGPSPIIEDAYNVLLDTTSPTQVLTYSPTSGGDFTIFVYYRVGNSPTGITITASWSDGAGAQTIHILPHTIQQVGSYSVAPIYFNANTNAPVVISATADIANNVYVSTSLMTMTVTEQGGGLTQAYTTIQNSGVALPKQYVLNLTSRLNGTNSITDGYTQLDLSSSGVTPGSYISSDITVDAYGRITSASNGVPGGVISLTGGGGVTVSSTTGNITLNTSGIPESSITNLLTDLSNRALTSTSINTTAPITGGGNLSTNRTISIPKASTSVDGYLSSIDWNIFNNKDSGSVTNVTGTSPISSTGGTTPNITISAATDSYAGSMSSTDKVKLDALGNLFVIANDFAGGDIGAQINAANAALGSNPGSIYVLPGNYTMTTQVVLSADRFLKFDLGTITLADSGYGSFIFNNRNSIVGSGFGTKFVEKAASGQPAKNVFRDIHAWNNGNSDFTADGVSDVYFGSFQIAKGAPDFDSAVPTLAIGNGHRFLIEKIYLNYTSSLGIIAGASSADGYYSSDTTVSNCIFDHVASQALAAVNSTRFQFINNIFVATGQPGGPGATHIDLEPNIGTDLMSNFNVSGNIIYCTNPGVAGPGNGIIVQNGGATLPPGPGNVCNNVMFGTLFEDVPNPGRNDLSNGVFLAGVRDVNVIGNTVRKASQSGVTMSTCLRCNVSDNLLINCGGGGIPAFYLGDSTKCTITNNSLLFYDGVSNAVSADNSIQEAGSSDHNIIRNNEIGSFFGFIGYVLLVGANSVATGNTCDGIEFKTFVLDGAITANTLVKPGTTAGSVAQFTISDSPSDAIGVFLGGALNGSYAPVALLGTAAAIKIKSDGYGTIGIGAAVQPSTNINGHIVAGTKNQIGHNLGAAVAATLNAICMVQTTPAVSNSGSSVSNIQESLLSTTSATNVINYTTTSADNYVVYCYYRVITGATNLTLNITWTSVSGAQTQIIVPSATSQSVGDYITAPVFINATSGTTIRITATAGTANRILISGSVIRI